MERLQITLSHEILDLNPFPDNCASATVILDKTSKKSVFRDFAGFSIIKLHSSELTKERQINSGIYDLATAYLSLYLNH